MILAEELVASGGPSAPVWAFLSAISLALIGVLAQQMQLKAQARAAKDEASKANESATKAQENTVNIGNGFVGRVDRKLDGILEAQRATDRALREHIEWHLEKGTQ